MQKSIRTMIAKVFADRARRRKRMALVCVLSALVACGVFARLTQPVITKTADTLCGLPEHVHAEACYEKVLACALAEDESHAHAGDCYAAKQVCGMDAHTHGQECYPAELSEPTLPPQTEATPEPTDGQTGGETPASENEPTPEATVNAEPETTAEPEATAETEATPEATVTPEPTIVPEFPGTSQEEQLPAEAEPQILSLTADRSTIRVNDSAMWRYEVSGAQHISYEIRCDGETVSGGTLAGNTGDISHLAERAGQYVFILTVRNDLGSATAEAAVQVLEAEAISAHVSADVRSCFAGDSVTFALNYGGGTEPLTARVFIYQGDTLLAEYDEVPDSVTVQTQECEHATTLAATLAVSDALGEVAAVQCEIPVAVRIYENESKWEKSARTELTGEWPVDLIAVARTQLGYEESGDNFVIHEDGTQQGYTRYGHWYGSSYAEWCGMFVSFCLNYADVPETAVPREANCRNWVRDLKAEDLYADASEHTPLPGDLVFFSWESNDHPDHVGIVADVTGDTVTVIEGNSRKGVRSNEYDIDDDRLMGYGLINTAYERSLEETEQSDASVLLDMWLETTDAGETIYMMGELDAGIAEVYDWQWQTAPAADGEWTDIVGATDIVYAVPRTEESYNAYYRIVGNFDYFAQLPIAMAEGGKSTDDEPAFAPDAIVEVVMSDGDSPAARKVTGNSDKTIEVYYVLVDENGKVIGEAEKQTAITVPAAGYTGNNNGNGTQVIVPDLFSKENAQLYKVRITKNVESDVSNNNNIVYALSVYRQTVNAGLGGGWWPGGTTTTYTYTLQYVDSATDTSWANVNNDRSLYYYYQVIPNYTIVTIDAAGNQNVVYDKPREEAGNWSVTLAHKQNYIWECTGANGTIKPGTENDDGSVTFTFDPVDQSYIIRQYNPNAYTVTYNLNMDPAPFDQDSEYAPTVNGRNPYVVDVEKNSGKYAILAPNPLYYSYEDPDNSVKQVLKKFVHWLGSDGNTYSPGDQITLTGDMTFTAVWETIGNGDRECEFYVIYDLSAKSITSTNADWYTESVFTTEVVTNRKWTNDSNTYVIIGDSKTSNGGGFGINGEYNDKIVTLVDTPYKQGNYTYQLKDFPNNDYVFKQLRTMQAQFIKEYNDQTRYTSPDKYVEAKNRLIVLNGEIVTVDELNSANFEFDWFVFKRQGDGWHVDGRLIPRKASLTVTKTFYGDQNTIDNVTDNFNVTVSGDGYTTKTLKLSDAKQNGNTYTWVLKEELDRGKTYTVKENNYAPTGGSGLLTAAEYIITNTNAAGANEWHRYTSSGVSVVPVSYDSKTTTYQTVNLMNSYMPASSMMIHKINGVTGASLPGTEFQLSKGGEAVAPLYYKSGVYYMDLPAKPYDTIENGIVTSDDQGRIIIGWADQSHTVYGTYTLTETKAPVGYQHLEAPVEFELYNNNGTVNVRYSGDASVAEADGQLLRVKNEPQRFIVRVKKNWQDGTNEDVLLHLYRGNTKVGEVTLDGVVDAIETTPWECEWENLPLYDGNNPAQYRIVEYRIGSAYREESADTDGFPMYTVTLDSMVYLDNNGNMVTEPTQANYAVLGVNNKRTTNDFSFDKWDQNNRPLQGAEFSLYQPTGNVDETKLTAEAANGKVVLKLNGSQLSAVRQPATSDTNGVVNFGALPVGTYYMVESKAPAGYEANTKVYRVEIISASEKTITEVGSETAVKAINNRKIEVEVSFIKVIADTETPLEGAVFGVYSDEACTQKLSEIATDATGTGKATLPVGSYWLKEIAAPQGYVLSDTVYPIVVNVDKTFTIAGIADIKIPNEPNSTDVTVTKVDSNGKALNGAKFTIAKDGKFYPYDENNTSEFSPNNAFTLTGLTAGDYSITEKNAPMGYYRILNTIDFTVDVDGTIIVGELPAEVTYDVQTRTFTVINVIGAMLPETGGTGTILYTAGGAAMMSLALLLGYNKLRRRREGRAMR